jgi:nicotinic acid phosphoribosyltransferase
MKTPRHNQTAEGILFTDPYQLTMAQLYSRFRLHKKSVQFDRFFHNITLHAIPEGRIVNLWQQKQDLIVAFKEATPHE